MVLPNVNDIMRDEECFMAPSSYNGYPRQGLSTFSAVRPDHFLGATETNYVEIYIRIINRVPIYRGTVNTLLRFFAQCHR